MTRTTRIALLDDHPAIHLGLEAVVAAEADLELVGAVAGEAELWALLRLERPDVLVLDVHHPGRDGLELCLEIKRRAAAPAIVLYTAPTDETLTVAAALAGADAVVGKSRPAPELLDAIRSVALASRKPAQVSWRARRTIAARIDPADHAILVMRLDGESPAEIARTLGLRQDAVTDRIAAIIAGLEPLGSVA
jgi:DNA-binding NarL/FixJ family response regulator